MKILERNKMAFWYQLYDRKEIVEDEYGNETGSRLIYKPAVKFAIVFLSRSSIFTTTSFVPS